MAFMFEEEHDIETAKPRAYVGDENSFTLWGVEYVSKHDPSSICMGCHFAFWTEACANTPACSDMCRRDGLNAIFVPKDPESAFVTTRDFRMKTKLVDDGKINAKISCVNL